MYWLLGCGAVGTGSEATPARAPVNLPPAALLEPVVAGTAGAALEVPWGSAHPVHVAALASDAGWAVLCQARHDSDGDGHIAVHVGARGELVGDRLEPFLVEGGGDGQPIAAFVSADPSGRFLVIRADGTLLLRDTRRHGSIDLRAPGADGTSRAPRFSPDGRWLAYVRTEAGHERAVVRELESGDERVVDAGAGWLSSVDVDPSSEWLLLRTLAAPPAAAASNASEPDAATCAAPGAAYTLPVRSRGQRTWIAPLRGGTPRDAGRFVASLGVFGWLRRAPDHALVLEAPDGDGSGTPASELWALPGCDARLLHADPSRGLALLACLGNRVRVELVGGGQRNLLGFELPAFALDGVVAGLPRFVPLYARPRRRPVLVDLDTREVLPLEPRDQVIATGSGAVLVRRRERLYVGDPRRPLAPIGPVDALTPVLRTPPSVFMAPWVVDLEQGRVLGRVDAEGLGLTRSGAVLVAASPGDAGALPEGPLRWQAPSDAGIRRPDIESAQLLVQRQP